MDTPPPELGDSSASTWHFQDEHELFLARNGWSNNQPLSHGRVAESRRRNALRQWADHHGLTEDQVLDMIEGDQDG